MVDCLILFGAPTCEVWMLSLACSVTMFIVHRRQSSKSILFKSNVSSLQVQIWRSRCWKVSPEFLPKNVLLLFLLFELEGEKSLNSPICQCNNGNCPFLGDSSGTRSELFLRFPPFLLPLELSFVELLFYAVIPNLAAIFEVETTFLILFVVLRLCDCI